MDDQIVQRIRHVRKHYKLTQVAFAERIGYGRGVIENIERGLVPPKQLFLQQISKVYNVDLDWLLTGEGEPFLEKSELETLLEFATHVYADTDLAWLRRLCEYVNALDEEERKEVARYIEGISAAIAPKSEKQEP